MPRPASDRRYGFTRNCSHGCSPKSTRSSRNASNRDVHDKSKTTTLPIAREIVAKPTSWTMSRLPWYIDLLNISLNNYDLATAKSRIRSYSEAFERDGTRITENLDFGGLKQGTLP